MDDATFLLLVNPATKAGFPDGSGPSMAHIILLLLALLGVYWNLWRK